MLRIPNTIGDLERTFAGPNTDTEFPWRMRVTTSDGKEHLLATMRGWRRFFAEKQTVASVAPEFLDMSGEPVVFARPCRAREVMGRALRYQGVRTFSETDDNYFAPQEQNIFSRMEPDIERRHLHHALAMASMQGVIFSTAWLRDRYVKEFRQRFKVKGIEQRRWMPELFVCRNHIPSWHWPQRAEYEGPVRVGFMGSPSHVWDVGRLGYASFHAAKQLGARTIFIGYNPADPDPDIPDFVEVDGVQTATRTDESLAVSRKWQGVVDEHIRWVDPLVFKRGGLPLDIALAPLLWNEFNAGRSDIKAVEAVVAGAAPVVSRHPVFHAGGWRHGVNCLMGGSQEALAEQVVRLIREPALRAELVAAGREMVAADRGEDALRAEWVAALDG